MATDRERGIDAPFPIRERMLFPLCQEEDFVCPDLAGAKLWRAGDINQKKERPPGKIDYICTPSCRMKVTESTWIQCSAILPPAMR